MEFGLRLRAAVVAPAMWLAVMLAPAQAAEDKTYLMKLTFPTINDLLPVRQELRRRVTKDSGGRIKTEI
jgi:hypothetical protein